jgi:putative transposase
MKSPSYARCRFPLVVIQRAGWLYFKFNLSYRDVDDLLAEPSTEVSYETIRRWVMKFGRICAAQIRKRRPQGSGKWHLDDGIARQVMFA